MSEKGLVSIITKPWGRAQLDNIDIEASNGVNSAPLVGSIRIGAQSDIILIGQKHALGLDVNMSSIIQVALIPDPTDPDPDPHIAPPSSTLLPPELG